MEVKTQKQIVDYFSFFDEFHTTAKGSLRDCQNYAATINKLIKRCKNIKEADVTGTPLIKFEDLQIKLCAVQHNLISHEIYEIRCKQSTLEDLFEILWNKNKALRESCKDTNFDENSPLIKGSPTQPSLKQLLEFADDTITFASHACAQIESALSILSFKKLDTVTFSEHFWYPVDWNRRVQQIITYTSFIENQA